MLNMVSINLDSITTQEAFIINKAPIDGKETYTFAKVYSNK